MRTLVIVILIGLLAAALQVFALVLLWNPWALQHPLLAFCVAQLAAALAAAWFFLYCHSPALRHPAWKATVFYTSLIFFLPLGGQMLLSGVLLLNRILPRRARDSDIQVVEPPVFEPRLLDMVQYGGAARARSLAGSERADIAQRMTAMIAVRRADTRVTGDLLRSLLSDAQDEMRLLAYGIIEQAEKRILSDIVKVTERLRRRMGTRQAAVDHAHLADLNWELIYQDLVQGEVRDYVLDQIAEHARASLALRPNLAGMHYLLGRRALLLDDPVEARQSLRQACEHGMSEARIAPWMAQAYFQQQRIHDVRSWMQRVPLTEGGSELQAVARYWQ